MAEETKTKTVKVDGPYQDVKDAAERNYKSFLEKDIAKAKAKQAEQKLEEAENLKTQKREQDRILKHSQA